LLQKIIHRLCRFFFGIHGFGREHKRAGDYSLASKNQLRAGAFRLHILGSARKFVAEYVALLPHVE
jgi:hypothetical protein